MFSRVSDIFYQSAAPNTFTMILSEIIDRQIDSRNLSILCDVCGLESGTPASMRSVGHRYGLTAERVRQIMGQIRDQMFLAGKQEEMALIEFCKQQNSPDLPVIASDIANQKASEIFGRPVTLGGLNNLLLAIGRQTGHITVPLGVSVALVSEGAPDIVPLWRKISVAAKRIARSRGAVRAADIVQSVSTASEPVREDLVTLCLSIMPYRASASIDGHVWYIFDEMPNMVRRAIFFCQTAGPLRIERKNSVIFPPSIVEKSIPLDVVQFVLVNFGFKIVGEDAVLGSGVVFRDFAPRDRHLGLSKTQERMINILVEHGPMPRDQFLTACVESGINTVTATIYLYRGYFVNQDGKVFLPSQAAAV